MKSSNDYLDEMQKTLGLSSDYALAKALGVARSTVSRYRSGRPLDLECAWIIAEALNIDPSEIIAVAEIERAERSQDPEKAATWKARFQAVTAHVAGVLGVIALPYLIMATDQLCILC